MKSKLSRPLSLVKANSRNSLDDFVVPHRLRALTRKADKENATQRKPPHRLQTRQHVDEKHNERVRSEASPDCTPLRGEENDLLTDLARGTCTCSDCPIGETKHTRLTASGGNAATTCTSGQNCTRIDNPDSDSSPPGEEERRRGTSGTLVHTCATSPPTSPAAGRDCTRLECVVPRHRPLDRHLSIGISGALACTCATSPTTSPAAGRDCTRLECTVLRHRPSERHLNLDSTALNWTLQAPSGSPTHAHNLAGPISSTPCIQRRRNCKPCCDDVMADYDDVVARFDSSLHVSNSLDPAPSLLGSDSTVLAPDTPSRLWARSHVHRPEMGGAGDMERPGDCDAVCVVNDTCSYLY